jgi:hypothetical protein
MTGAEARARGPAMVSLRTTRLWRGLVSLAENGDAPQDETLP